MATKILLNKKTNKWYRVFSMRFRLLATVIFAMLAIALCIGGLSVYEVDRYVQSQAEDFVEVVCDNESAKINESLKNMEKSVKVMESYLMDFFPDGVDVTDPVLQKKIIANADQMFADVAQLTSIDGAVSYYFRMDPAIAGSKAGLFYCKLDGSDRFESFEITDLDLYDKDDTEHVGWFWQPYEAGKAIWMKPYLNKNNGVMMISYVIPMYVGEQFVAVVGMDFDYLALSQQVHNVKVYENGFAHLEIDGQVLCDENHNDSAADQKQSAKYLRVSRELANGMTLVVSANYNDIQRIRNEISSKIVLTGVIIAVLFIALAVVVAQKVVNPLKKLTDAAAKLSTGDYDMERIHSNTREIQLLSAAFEDMSQRLREREEQLQMTANYDSLTGLRNTTSYAAWVAKFDREILGKKAAFGVVMLDLNDLKKTNDRYGHAVGDELIVTAARLLSDVFKRSPVFRIGGDEFLVVLQNKDLENRESLLTQFRQDCANTFLEKEGQKIPVCIASGCAVFDGTADQQFADVFKRADVAMYKNKMKSKTGMVQ